MKKWLKWSLIVLGAIFLLIVLYFSISTIFYLSKESKIRSLEVGMTLQEFEKVLGEPLYEGKYCEEIQTQRTKEIINKSIEATKGCALIEGGDCTLDDISEYRDNKEAIQCLEMYPDETTITYCEYNGNPKPVLSERTIRLYYNQENIVCAIERYGLGI